MTKFAVVNPNTCGTVMFPGQTPHLKRWNGAQRPPNFETPYWRQYGWMYM